MGKKDAEQMSKEREKFRRGALETGIDEKTSMQIFDKMEKFAAYGFNNRMLPPMASLVCDSLF